MYVLNLGFQNHHYQYFNNHIRIILSFNSFVYSSYILSLYTVGSNIAIRLF